MFEGFHTIVLEVIRSIPDTDTGLRDTVLAHCAKFVEHIVGAESKDEYVFSELL